MAGQEARHWSGNAQSLSRARPMLQSDSPSTMRARLPSCSRCALMISRRRAMAPGPSADQACTIMPRHGRASGSALAETMASDHIFRVQYVDQGTSFSRAVSGVILRLPGGPAHSEFRLAKLLRRSARRSRRCAALRAASCTWSTVGASRRRPSARSSRHCSPTARATAASAPAGADSAGGAAAGHHLAVVQQGHRHCAGLRARLAAPDRARHRLPLRIGSRADCGRAGAASRALLHDRMTEAGAATRTRTSRSCSPLASRVRCAPCRVPSRR